MLKIIENVDKKLSLRKKDEEVESCKNEKKYSSFLELLISFVQLGLMTYMYMLGSI